MIINNVGYPSFSSINLIVCPNIKKYYLIFQLHIDYSNIPSDRKGPPTLQCSAEGMVIKWFSSFTRKKEFIALAELSNQLGLKFYALLVVFFKIAVKNYQLHGELR